MNIDIPLEESVHHSSPPNITAIILTLNEESTIADAIRSLEWCQKIFVVDSKSSDQTCKIATELGAEVVIHRDEGKFLISRQRNWSIENLPISTDWILFLDADELATPSFAQAVRETLAQSGSQTAFYAAPAFYYYGKWLKRISGYPNWHPRIIHRLSNVRFSGGVWEDFDSPAEAGHVKVPYVHRTNSKGLNDWVEKHIRYAEWESERISAQLSGNNDTATRRSVLRKIRYSTGPLRKYLSLLYLAVWRGGLLDGRHGISYLRRMFVYELLIDEFRKEHATKTSKGEL